MDDRGVIGAECLDRVDDVVGLLQLQAAVGGDVHDHPARALQVHAVEQRRGHRLLGRDPGAVQPGGFADAHHRLALLAHHGAHVGEVHVDQARDVDDLGDAGHRVVQHVVGAAEGVLEAGVVVHDLEELLVQHDDQRVDVLDQLLDALLGDLHLLRAFELEGLGDDAHGQHAELLGDLGNDRRRAGAGALAHAGGQEDHVGPLKRGADLVSHRVGGGASGFGPGAGAQAHFAELDRALGERAAQGLLVGVQRDELDALHAAVDHVVDRVAAGATDADHLDHGAFHFVFDHFKAHRTGLLDGRATVRRRRADRWHAPPQARPRGLSLSRCRPVG